MKKSFFLLVFSGLALLAHAQDVPALYTAVSGSIVYLQHEIFLNSSDCTKPELWKRLEKLTKRSVLNAPWPLMSGSGFFVDNDGTILTNRHVVKIGGLQIIRYNAIQSVAEGLDKNFSSNFSADELAVMKKDFEAMISKGRYSFKAMIGTQDIGAVTILAEASEDEPDLALLKVGGGPFRGIKLAASTMIGPDLVGTEVLSFGYPLGSGMDVMFEERTVTMNRGTISAFRRTELGLQHSAAISHGNSGGPLLNREGLALGVNTAGVQEGNSLFYAIDIGKVRDFLNKKGFGNILLWNQRLSNIVAADSNLKLNALGEIESSADVMLDIDKNVDVLLDGTKMGVGPLFLHLVNPVSLLELHGPTGGFSAKLRLLSTISGSTTLKPSLALETIPVTINSNPSGAMVIADGKNLGKTPLNIALAADKYAVRLRQDGQWYEGTSFEIRTGQANEFSFNGQPTFPITFKDLPQEVGATLHFESKLGKVAFQESDKVALPTGDWSLIIEGSDAFAGVTIPVQVQKEPVTLDFAPLKRKASLRIVGLDSKAKVWIDDKLVPNHATDTLQLPVGVHAVYVWENGLQPLDRINITVRSDNNSYVTWDRLRGHDANIPLFGWSGVGAGAVGSLLVGLGLYCSQNSVALSQTSSYQEYVSYRNGATTAVVSGIGLAVGAVVVELIALGQRNKYEAQRKYMTTLESKQ
jgi:hypothetical protein